MQTATRRVPGTTGRLPPSLPPSPDVPVPDEHRGRRPARRGRRRRPRGVCRGRRTWPSPCSVSRTSSWIASRTTEPSRLSDVA
nr:hypothetical protein [Angustibacter aerolatus]